MKLLVLVALVTLSVAEPLETEWIMWRREHGKVYANTAEETYRYGIWKESTDMIEAHNKLADEGKVSYWLGMNHFGDMTQEEIVSTFNGYIMQDNGENSTDVFKPTPNFVPEDEVDWRTKGAVTLVKNQGQCGSCWAFSATGSLEGQHFLKNGQLVSLSEQNLVDCSKKEGNDGCQGGLMVSAFKYVIKNDGIDTEKSYPYRAHNEKCSFKKADVGATEESYKKIEKDSIDGVVEACSKIGPIAAAMDASQRSFSFYKKGVYQEKKCSSKLLDHGVLVVGYGTQDGEDYFLMKNSWGRRWGIDGFFMIARKDNMCGIATDASYPIV